MSTGFPFIEIPEELYPIIGEPDPGTRLYRQAGLRHESGKWYEQIRKYVGDTVSPGGVAMFVRGSRAGMYKRIKEGRLSAFCFHVLKPRLIPFGEKYYRSSPFIYIPVEEIKAWGKELNARRALEELEAHDPDINADFWQWDAAWRKKKIKEERGKPLR
jgi:hypothetical protein